MPFVAGLVQALLMFVAFEPVAWWPVALLAPIPGLWIAARPGGVSWKAAAALALGTLPFWLWHHLFIMDITGPGFVPLVIYLSAWPGLAVWLLARVRGAWPRLAFWIAAPAVFTGLDMLRGEIVLTGYAWFLPGQPLIDSPAAPAGAAVGIYGVSLLVVLLAAGVVRLTMPGRRDAGVWAIVLAGGLTGILVGAAALAASGGESDVRTARIAIVQTNVAQSNKLAWTPDRAADDYTRLLQLTESAAASDPRLIIWPETMKFGWVLTDAQIAETEALLVKHPELQGLRDYIRTGEMARDAAVRVGRPILMGQETIEGLDFVEKNGKFRMVYSARYNSSYLVHGRTVDEERYDKLEPTPFGENIPYASHWPWLRDRLTDFAAGGMRIDLATGTRRTVFNVGQSAPLRVVTPICFESTDAALCRSLVYEGGKRRADLIACMTNDGWFGHSHSGRLQHLQLARWRCLELGTPMARSANTGLSAFIDADGRILTPRTGGPDALTGDVFEKDGVLVADLQTPAAPTLYGRIGNVAGWGSLAAAGMLWAPTLRRRKTAPETPQPPAAGPPGPPGGTA